MKRILVSAPTEGEIHDLLLWLERNWRKRNDGGFEKNGVVIECLVTGVGPVMTAYQLGKRTEGPPPLLAIQMGIAGAFPGTLRAGDLVEIRNDRFGNWGAREATGRPLSVFELELVRPNEPPFQGGALINPSPMRPELKQVSGITVMETTGTTDKMEELQKLFTPDIETMEAASFMFGCLQAEWDFLCVRAISNMVGPRDRHSWDIPLALERLTSYMARLLNELAMSENG